MASLLKQTTGQSTRFSAFGISRREFIRAREIGYHTLNRFFPSQRASIAVY
jgi:hypothetical protein